jgi:hypothetical protein
MAVIVDKVVLGMLGTGSSSRRNVLVGGKNLSNDIVSPAGDCGPLDWDGTGGVPGYPACLKITFGANRQHHNRRWPWKQEFQLQRLGEQKWVQYWQRTQRWQNAHWPGTLEQP